MFQSARPRGARRRHATASSSHCARFNPRAREGRDTCAGCSPETATCFNPRAREGRDVFELRVVFVEHRFNPRAREGRDFSTGKGQPQQITVSIRAPARGATVINHANDRTDFVSIRAPARGATTPIRTSGIVSVFQSARPRGARQDRPHALRPRTMFQSARPRGARPARGVRPRLQPVSIRAPARGATDINCRDIKTQGFQSARPRGARRMEASITSMRWSFQSARPRGARPLSIARACQVSPFQSARPRGARPATSTGRWRAMCFNPRAREGRDLACLILTVMRPVSIRAPARGATGLPSSPWGPDRFNPRAREGRDSSGPMRDGCRPRFNPRAREGRDHHDCRDRQREDVSIRAPARGATATGVRYLPNRVYIGKSAKGNNFPSAVVGIILLIISKIFGSGGCETREMPAGKMNAWGSRGIQTMSGPSILRDGLVP